MSAVTSSHPSSPSRIAGATFRCRAMLHRLSARAPHAGARSFAAAAPARTKVVILGSGWGGNRLARKLDKELYEVTLVSPANHFLVTPLLPQTALGTLEAVHLMGMGYPVRVKYSDMRRTYAAQRSCPALPCPPSCRALLLVVVVLTRPAFPFLAGTSRASRPSRTTWSSSLQSSSPR